MNFILRSSCVSSIIPYSYLMCDFFIFEYFMIEDRFHYTLSKLDISMNFDEKPVKKL